MGKRLTGFDYSRPFFYMVTIKCHPGRRALSEIVEPGVCRMNATTRAMVNCIRNFHLGCKAVAPIECFSIMPDHIHLLVRLVENPDRLRLETIVSQMMAALEGRYAETTGLREEVFDARWHDWIVARKGQLAAFTRYIRENPRRRFLRRSHPEYFCRVADLSFAGRTWKAYGNAELLGLPVVEPFQCSRRWAEGGPEWRAALARAERIGPGGAGIGTFMSPCEKACGNAIFQEGGALIVLTPEGFGPRWHPARNKEALCAKGRMLFLTLYEPSAARPDRAALHRRCHEMGDLAVAALAGRRGYEQDSYAGAAPAAGAAPTTGAALTAGAAPAAGAAPTAGAAPAQSPQPPLA